MYAWLDAALAKLSKKSNTAGAIRYALFLSRALMRCVNDGQLAIDNYAAERILRVVTLGGKNPLFAGSHRRGERAEAMYTLLVSASLNGLDPDIYLQRTHFRSPDQPYRGLLPWNVAPNRVTDQP